MSKQEYYCRRLIASVIRLAIHDVWEAKNWRDSDSAVNFLDINNRDFCRYCWYLDIDPEYLLFKLKNILVSREAYKAHRKSLKKVIGI
jgi:hypothetical protein